MVQITAPFYQNPSIKPATEKDIETLYAEERALEDTVQAAMDAVADVEAPEGASEEEVSLLRYQQFTKAAELFLQDLRDWEKSLTKQERRALGLETMPEQEAYINEHVVDVCGA